jgi:hypothetical protein
MRQKQMIRYRPSGKRLYHGRVIATFYNGVPPKSPGKSGSSTVTVPVPHGEIYEIKLCMTLARTSDEGAAHAEQGGGHSKIFAKIKSD